MAEPGSCRIWSSGWRSDFDYQRSLDSNIAGSRSGLRRRRRPGQRRQMVATNTDIADRKEGEKALSASDLHFRQIVDGIPALIAVMNAAGEVEVVNRPVLEYFGKTLEELKSWANGDAVHPDDLPSLLAAWRRAVETGQPFESEHRQRRADGVYRWFHARALPMRDGWRSAVGVAKSTIRKRLSVHHAGCDAEGSQVKVSGNAARPNAAGEAVVVNRQAWIASDRIPIPFAGWPARVVSPQHIGGRPSSDSTLKIGR
jgi:PAS domain S-box-containing protein